MIHLGSRGLEILNNFYISVGLSISIGKIASSKNRILEGLRRYVPEVSSLMKDKTI